MSQVMKPSQMMMNRNRHVVVPDIGNPENLTKEERMSRVLHSRMAMKRSKQHPTVVMDDKMFDHFIVVGIPPKDTLKYKRESRSIPHVLYHFPQEAPLEGLRVAQFLFPDGVRAKTTPQTGSHSDLFEALYTQTHLKHPEDAHVFMLTTETKEILYGVCIAKQEPVNVSKKDYDVDLSEDIINDLVQSDVVVIAWQAYCFISKLPFFEVHFSILKQILAMQHMQMSRFRVSDGTSSSDRVQQIQTSSSLLSSTSTRPIFELLQAYQNTPVPPPTPLKKKIMLQIGQLEPIPFFRPSVDEDSEEFLKYGLAVILQVLPKELIFLLISAVMLEKRIVIVSPNMRTLTSIVLSIVPLIRPFVYQSVFLPVIPQSLQIVYTAPVPFVVGATTLPKESELNDELIIVDVVKKNIVIPPGVHIPLLPRLRELITKVDLPISKMQRAFTANHPNGIPYNPLPTESNVVEAICSIFQHHIGQLFINFRSHCITDISDSKQRVSVFLKENFVLLEFEDPEEQKFIRSFLETQMFFDYSDKLLRGMDEKPPS